MPRILIVACSCTGNNRRLARYLGEQFEAQVIEVQERRPRRGFDILLDLLFHRRPRIRPLGVDARACDHVLFVGPTGDKHIATPLLGAMDQLAPVLRSCSFASLCGYDRPGQREAIMGERARRPGRPPEHIAELVVGHLLPPSSAGASALCRTTA